MEILEEYIRKNKNMAYDLINKSKLRKFLDNHDVSEIVHACLWKAYCKYNPEKASLKTFLSTIMRNYSLSLLRKKFKRISRKMNRPFYLQQNETPLIFFQRLSENGQLISLNSENALHEYCNEYEWDLIRPLSEGYTLADSAQICNMSRATYTKLIRTIGGKIKGRMIT